MTMNKDEAIRADMKLLQTFIDDSADEPESRAFYNMRAWIITNLHATSHITPDAAVEVEGRPTAFSEAMGTARIVYAGMPMATECLDYLQALIDNPLSDFGPISPAIAPEASELPVKPAPVRMSSDQSYLGYTAEQMDDHARAAIAMHQSVSNRAAAAGAEKESK